MTFTEEAKIIRELAKRQAEIAAGPRYEVLRRRWAAHNELDASAGPLLWICPDADGGWLELVAEDTLETTDPDLRRLERHLRQELYRHAHFEDDYVQEPVARFDLPGEYTGYHYGDAAQRTAWGIAIRGKAVGQDAYRLENYLEEEGAVERLLAHKVDFIPDAPRAARLREKVGEALGGALRLELNVPYTVLVQSLLIELVHLWSLEGLMVGLYDCPEQITRVMDHMSASKARLLKRLEEQGLLFDNHSNIYTGSGGLGYTRHPPADAERVRLSEMWGFADSQEFSNVSPAMFEEFALRYQKRGLGLFDLACYGCCEPLDDRLELIFDALPNLRRLSVSPWSNMELAAEGIGKRAIYSWKPNPVLFSGPVDEADSRPVVERAARASRDNVVEIIMKDIRTCGHTPAHLQRFAGLVRRAFG